jgi:hypothetical protein
MHASSRLTVRVDDISRPTKKISPPPRLPVVSILVLAFGDATREVVLDR